EAVILPVPVVDGDGTVHEHELYRALLLLLLRHIEGQIRGGAEDQVIDVLSLSLGYYHETPEDARTSSFLRALLDEYGRRGVLVVAAAGNDATTLPMLPAAFAAPEQPGERDRLPVVSVGALNPPGRTTAFFSNTGRWVSCQRVGVGMVSTMPTSFNGSAQRSIEAKGLDGVVRGTLDPDDYSGGFATWSGTSFAAPAVAGALAAHLVAASDVGDVSPAAMLTRGWSALRTELRWRRP